MQVAHFAIVFLSFSSSTSTEQELHFSVIVSRPNTHSTIVHKYDHFLPLSCINFARKVQKTLCKMLYEPCANK